MVRFFVHVCCLDGVSSDGVVSRELVKRTVAANLFVRRSSLDFLLASMSGGAISSNVQAAAAVVNTVRSCACTNGALKTVLVLPALEVIAVKSVASSVAHSPDRTVGILNGTGVVEEFIEDGKDGLGVRFGADTKVVVANGREGNLYAVRTGSLSL